MPRLWITKDNPETSKPKSETKRIYTPEVRIIRPEIISNIPPGLYSCTCLDYNDVSYLNALAASGALSLGTTAGTDRSISGEFGGTTPHALSEYYGVASGVPASGTIDFSDFHGTSAGPPVTDCLWTHYDLSSCTENDEVCNFSTTAFAMCTQMMCIGRWSPSGGTSYQRKICDQWEVYQGCICKYNNGVHNNRSYLYTEDFNSVVSSTETAYWGNATINPPYDNSVFMVAKAFSPTLKTVFSVNVTIPDVRYLQISPSFVEFLFIFKEISSLLVFCKILNV